MRRVELADYLLIAEIHLGVDADRLARQADLGLLESALAAPFAGWGDQDHYPTLTDKAAVLCSRLIRNHPLIDGNKRSAYSAMIEFIERNGHAWSPPEGSDEQVEIIEALAAREISEPEFAEWLGRHITRAG